MNFVVRARSDERPTRCTNCRGSTDGGSAHLSGCRGHLRRLPTEAAGRRTEEEASLVFCSEASKLTEHEAAPRQSCPAVIPEGQHPPSRPRAGFTQPPRLTDACREAVWRGVLRPEELLTSAHNSRKEVLEEGWPSAKVRLLTGYGGRGRGVEKRKERRDKSWSRISVHM